jgi:hypothetical protein
LQHVHFIFKGPKLVIFHSNLLFGHGPLHSKQVLLMLCMPGRQVLTHTFCSLSFSKGISIWTTSSQFSWKELNCSLSSLFLEIFSIYIALACVSGLGVECTKLCLKLFSRCSIADVNDRLGFARYKFGGSGGIPLLKIFCILLRYDWLLVIVI